MKALYWLDHNFERFVCIALFMIFTTIMVVNVFMRYIAGHAIPWASDLVLFIFVWFVWFAISLGFRNGAHVNVTAVVGLLPPKAQKVMSIVCYIITLCGFAYIFYFGCKLLGDGSIKGQYGLSVHYPLWLLYLATPIGSGLSIIRVIQCIYEKIIGKENI